MRISHPWIPVAVLAIAGCATSRAEVRPRPAVAAPASAKAAPTKTATAKAATAAAKAAPGHPAGPGAIAPKPRATPLEVNVREATGGRWPTVEEARHRAQQAGKPLLLEFSTSWCGPCREFARRFVPSPPVAFRLAQVVYVSYDAEKGAGVDAAAQLGIVGYPTFLLLDGHGTPVWSQLGSADSPARFADLLDRGLAKALSAKAVHALVAKGASPEAELLAAAWAHQHGELAEARRDLKAAEAADPGDKAGVAARAQHLLSQMETGARLARRLMDADRRLAAKYPGSAPGRQALVALLSLGGPQAPGLARAAHRVVAATSSTAALNSLVYSLVGAGLPGPAVAAARKQVSLAPGDYNAYDTLGEALAAAGHVAQATAASDHALKLARKAKVDPMMLGALKANRARYAKGGVSPWAKMFESERHQLRENLDHLDTESLLTLERPTWHPQPQTAFDRALTRRLQAAGRGCEGEVQGARTVKVRVELTPPQRTPTKVTVLTQGTPKGLVKCLETRIAAGRLPFVPGGHHRGTIIPYTRVIAFGPATAPQASTAPPAP